MNVHFLKGFLKIAEPELAKQTSTGVEWDKPTEHRHKRQKVLEMYENKGTESKRKTAVKDDTSNKNPNDYASSRGTNYDG